MDEEVANFLRKEISNDIPVHVAVNKCESENTGSLQAAEFWNLGLGTPFTVSAIHGIGTAELLESLFASIDEMKPRNAIDGFGTKVKELQAAKQAVVDAVEAGDDVDQLMRKYGIGADSDTDSKGTTGAYIEARGFLWRGESSGG